jgi:hypothetical protein
MSASLEDPDADGPYETVGLEDNKGDIEKSTATSTVLDDDAIMRLTPLEYELRLALKTASQMIARKEESSPMAVSFATEIEALVAANTKLTSEKIALEGMLKQSLTQLEVLTKYQSEVESAGGGFFGSMFPHIAKKKTSAMSTPATLPAQAPPEVPAPRMLPTTTKVTGGAQMQHALSAGGSPKEETEEDWESGTSDVVYSNSVGHLEESSKGLAPISEVEVDADFEIPTETAIIPTKGGDPESREAADFEVTWSQGDTTEWASHEPVGQAGEEAGEHDEETTEEIQDIIANEVSDANDRTEEEDGGGAGTGAEASM